MSYDGRQHVLSKLAGYEFQPPPLPAGASAGTGVFYRWAAKVRYDAGAGQWQTIGGGYRAPAPAWWHYQAAPGGPAACGLQLPDWAEPETSGSVALAHLCRNCRLALGS